MIRRKEAVLISAGFGAFLAASAAHAQLTVYAIGNGGSSLIRFSSNDPSNATVVGNFSGAASSLNAIDFRPATGQLYGYLDSTDSFYTVDLNTGQLTLESVGASGAPTNTSQLGMDFNPTIDRARVITDSNQNIVFNPNAGTAAAFTDVFYAPGDVNENANPSIIDIGYTQNFAGATTTQQFGIDYGLNVLVTIANNDGTLNTVGPLGVNTDTFTGFDIHTSGSGVDTAYAILSGINGINPTFYTIDLNTGLASPIGALGFTNEVYSLAVIPAPGFLGLLGMGAGLAAMRRRR